MTGNLGFVVKNETDTLSSTLTTITMVMSSISMSSFSSKSNNGGSTTRSHKVTAGLTESSTKIDLIEASLSSIIAHRTIIKDTETIGPPQESTADTLSPTPIFINPSATKTISQNFTSVYQTRIIESETRDIIQISSYSQSDINYINNSTSIQLTSSLPAKISKDSTTSNLQSSYLQRILSTSSFSTIFQNTESYTISSLSSSKMTNQLPPPPPPPSSTVMNKEPSFSISSSSYALSSDTFITTSYLGGSSPLVETPVHSSDIFPSTLQTFGVMETSSMSSQESSNQVQTTLAVSSAHYTSSKTETVSNVSNSSHISDFPTTISDFLTAVSDFPTAVSDFPTAVSVSSSSLMASFNASSFSSSKYVTTMSSLLNSTSHVDSLIATVSSSGQASLSAPGLSLTTTTSFQSTKATLSKLSCDHSVSPHTGLDIFPSTILSSKIYDSVISQSETSKIMSRHISSPCSVSNSSTTIDTPLKTINDSSIASQNAEIDSFSQLLINSTLMPTTSSNGHLSSSSNVHISTNHFNASSSVFIENNSTASSITPTPSISISHPSSSHVIIKEDISQKKGIYYFPSLCRLI